MRDEAAVLDKGGPARQSPIGRPFPAGRDDR